MKPFSLRQSLLIAAVLGSAFVIGTILAYSSLAGWTSGRVLLETEELARESAVLGQRVDSLQAAISRIRAYVLDGMELPEGEGRGWMAERQDRSIEAALGLSGISGEMRLHLATAADLESSVSGLLNESLAQTEIGLGDRAAESLKEAERLGQELSATLLLAQALGLELLLERQQEVAKANTRALQFGLGWSALGIGVTILALLWLQARFYEPFKRLEEGVSRIGAGTWIGPIKITRDDELGRLTTILNQASENVHGRSEAQARITKGLSERLGRLLADSSNEIFIFRADDLKLVEMNEATRNNLGFREGETGPESPLDFVSGLGDGELLKQLRSTETGNEEILSVDWEHQREDGSRYPVEGSIQYSGAEDPPVFLAVVRDVTEEKEKEDRLRQAEKMEAMGQLTGGVAHDFNNLLTVILGGLEFVDMDLAEDSPTKGFVKDAIAATQRGSSLTHQLLAYSRRQPLKPVHTDLNQLLEDLDELLRRTIPERVEIEMARGAGLWKCEVDPTQLQNAVLNLALNAKDSMPDGGKLRLETSNADLDEAYTAEFRGFLPGHYVLLAVTDTGSGMSEAVRVRVFEPFFTTKEVGKGSGMGLSMVLGFVKQSGGYVNVLSEEGTGTTIRLYLPRVLPEDGEDALVDMMSSGDLPLGSGERILVVEDDDAVRGLACTRLKNLGYRTIDVADGPGALEVLGNEGKGGFALLFTDVVLPGEMTGKDLADRAREMDPDLPVLFTSGYAKDVIIHKGRLDPGVELLEKPYRQEVLSLKIRQALGSRS